MPSRAVGRGLAYTPGGYYHFGNDHLWCVVVQEGSRMNAIGHALAIAGSMTWEILWALILGFALSAVVQAVVRRSTIVRLLGDDRPRTLATATGMGIASSSCSYAAVALARSLFRKGATFTAALAFMIARTNLVIELGIVLALL